VQRIKSFFGRARWEITAAKDLIAALPPTRRPIADKGYDANHRRRLRDTATQAVIPSTASCNIPYPLDAHAYIARNVIERMFCRLKDFRQIATRYDKLDVTFSP